MAKGNAWRMGRMVTLGLVGGLAAAVMGLATLTGGGEAEAASKRTDNDCEQDRDQDLRIQACTRIIEDKSESRSIRAIAYNNRGNAWYAKGEHDKAIADLTEAIRLKPDYAEAYAVRGDAWRNKGEHDKAIADSTEVIRLKPDDALAYNNRGLTWHNKGEHDKAIADLTEAIRLMPDLAKAYAVRGNAWDAKGEHDKAIADYNQAIRLMPALAIAYYYNRGNAWLNKGEHDKAIADSTEAIRLKPDDAVAYVDRGNAWYAKGAYDKAIADLTEAIRLKPDYAIAYNLRAWVYYKMGRPEKGLADADRAIALDGKQGDSYDTRGHILLALGRDKEALADFEKAIALESRSPTTYWGRGQVYEHLGKGDKAFSDYRKAASLDAKGDPDLREAQQKARARLAALAEAEKRRRESPGATGATSAPSSALPPVSLRRRVALVIGNARYAHKTVLRNPPRDAKALAGALRRFDFAVVEKYDLDYQGLRRALQAFGREALGADWALVYYSGHGILVDGVNYLIPTDAALQSVIDVEDEALPLARVTAKVALAKKLGLVIMDACRNNPFVRSMRVAGLARSVASKGLGRPPETAGSVLIAYAARHGQVALDGDGPSSPYVEALLETLAKEPGLEIGPFFRKVRDRVLALTKGQQTPWTYGSLPAKAYAFKAP